MKKIFYLRLILFSCLTITFASCKKDKPANNTNSIGIVTGQGVLIANEGLFNGGNASLMYYRIGNENASQDLFSLVNDRPIGDVLQSMTLDGGRLYLVVNNSNRIESVQLPSLVSTGVIDGLSNPRYMVTQGSAAFVTGYGINGVQRVSLSDNTITGTIALPHWTDVIQFIGNELFVIAPQSDKLYICNPGSMQVTDSIAVGIGANSLVLDKDNNLWVFCAGESWNNIGGALVKIDPVTKSVIQTYNLGLTQVSAGRLCSNGTNDTLYFLNGDVYRMAITESLPANPFIEAGNRYLYSLYRHPSRNLVFVGDAANFLQNGTMFVYNANGVLEKQFEVGVGPTQVLAY